MRRHGQLMAFSGHKLDGSKKIIEIYYKSVKRRVAGKNRGR